MKIRSKLILNYSILSSILLLLFSIIVIFSYIKYRQKDFTARLHNRASSTANLLLNVSTVDSSMLRLIDRNIITAMGDLQITISSEGGGIIYNSSSTNLSNGVIKNTFLQNSILESFANRNKSIAFSYFQYGHRYEIEASANDDIGIYELRSLLHIIIWVLIFSLLFIAGFGFYSAVWSLKPFIKLKKEVDNIEPTLIKKRVSVHGNDELSQLAQSFNTLLDRIEQSIEAEKSFISNASHELRTPVTSVMGQIEVALNKSRETDEYKSILRSVYDDTTQMAAIINGFLELAETNLANNQVQMRRLRIDELLFAIIDDFEKKKSTYTVSLEFLKDPDKETQLECFANERLLRLLFSNLIDNACKYSDDNKAKISIDFHEDIITIVIVDFGTGIPKEDLFSIFKPLYRGNNTSGKPGHGLGLAIVKRIADLHNAHLDIKSEINLGTTVTVHLKK